MYRSFLEAVATIRGAGACEFISFRPVSLPQYRPTESFRASPRPEVQNGLSRETCRVLEVFMNGLLIVRHLRTLSNSSAYLVCHSLWSIKKNPRKRALTVVRER